MDAPVISEHSHSDAPKETKPKRVLTEEQLEKLAKARQKALEKKRERKALKDAEKEMKQQKIEERKQKVETFKNRVRKEDKPKAEETESSSSDEEVVEKVIVKKVPKRKTKKIVKKIIEVSSSSSESDSSDDETYRRQIKQKYKMKYQHKYEGTKQPRDILKDAYASPNALLREQASDVIRSNVSKELRKIALELMDANGVVDERLYKYSQLLEIDPNKVKAFSLYETLKQKYKNSVKRSKEDYKSEEESEVDKARSLYKKAKRTMRRLNREGIDAATVVLRTKCKGNELIEEETVADRVVRRRVLKVKR
jgi:hypothetical protein